MTKSLHFLGWILLSSLSLFAQEGQEHNVEVNTEAGYKKSAFVKLTDTPEGAKVTYITDSSWDLAFRRDNDMDKGIRVNMSKFGAIQVLEASSDLAQWNAISYTDESQTTMPVLYNSNDNIFQGALDNGSASQNMGPNGTLHIGWGTYQMSDHSIRGNRIFLLKYSATKYVKMYVVKYLAAYTIKYAISDGIGGWQADQEATISNATNPNSYFNYFSFENPSNSTQTILEPTKKQWDFMFTNDYEVVPGMGVYYSYGLILQNPEAAVAITAEGNTALPVENDYQEASNTIGKDFKVLSGYSYVPSTQNYYIKTEDGDLYKINFLTFEGSSTGKFSFKYKKVGRLSTSSFDDKVKFDIVPNPAIDKRINLIYEVAQEGLSTIAVFSLTGALVYESQLNAASGLHNQVIDLSRYPAGVYMVKVHTANQSQIKKVILK
ncbi:T9SS type A sorting domain-containing protein [Flavobacterium sp. NKUCC04_CG]|uniref:T9SS type A sorting domain-containing protein n=1 Tax=Flavobacterium sp. NKUCC04_CG TaxID=2842121 RepID=UPI001C5AF4CA|nr:T9SS type A sorting domain-containing protein [Flavobacterium sp. NKUCC04_CG]MBW3517602.1 T9SS type A sorting domain-containing protein [Flavobacterium sp. NKUCC04_CG]